MTERWRVRRILAGDPRAADEFVREHYPSVLRFLRHLTRSAADAEDLTQQTFLKARDGLARFEFGCRLSTWLHRIAYHEFTHWLRDRREVPGELPEASHHPAGRSEDAVVLAEAIAALPDDLRLAFLLREVQGLSCREAAKVLEVPEGTVKSRNHTARQRLREALRGTWEAIDDSSFDGRPHESA